MRSLPPVRTTIASVWVVVSATPLGMVAANHTRPTAHAAATVATPPAIPVKTLLIVVGRLYQLRVAASGADLTFAPQVAAGLRSECQIQSSTTITSACRHIIV